MACAVSTPRCAQRTIPATKRLHSDSPASLSPNIKPKSKRNKEEERKDQEISLNDIFALIKEMQADIKTKYQVIEEKVDTMEKNLQDKLSNLEKRMTEKMKEEVRNECGKVKEKLEEDFNHSMTFMEEALKEKMAEFKEHSIYNEQYSRKSSVRLFGIPEKEDENTESQAITFFKDVLKVEIKPDDIDICHRSRYHLVIAAEATEGLGR